MAYQIKTTGMASRALMLLMVDPDTGQITDYASSAVTTDLIIGANVTTGNVTWDGLTQKYFMSGPSVGTTDAEFVKFGTNKPTIAVNASNAQRTFVCLTEIGAGGTPFRVFGNNSSEYMSLISLAAGGATFPYIHIASQGFNGGQAAPTTGAKKLFGWNFIRGTSREWFECSDTATTINSGSTTLTNIDITYALNYVGRRNDNTIHDQSKFILIGMFSGTATMGELALLRDDPAGYLLEPVGGGDTTAPIISSATAISITSSGATIQASTDEDKGTFYVVISTSATTPSAAQIIAGQDHTGSAAIFSGNASVTATGTISRAASGLSASTAYYGHMVHRDAANNNSNTLSTAQFTTSAGGGDVTPPVISNVTISSISATGGLVSASTDEANGTAYVVVTTSATTPSVAQIIAGQTHTGSAAVYAGNTAITATGAYSVTASGLTSYTAYYAHTVHRDTAGNDSNTLTSAQFTTLDGTSPTLSGTITASSVTQTAYTLTWPAGSDNLAVTSYEYSLNAGTSYTDVGNALTINVTGRTAGATDAVRVRAKDAAGNVSSPLSLNVTLLNYGVDLQTDTVTYTVKNNTGTILSGTEFKLTFYRQDTDAFVVNKTITTDGSGLLGIVRDATLASGVVYDIKITNTANNHKGIFAATGGAV